MFEVKCVLGSIVNFELSGIVTEGLSTKLLQEIIANVSNTFELKSKEVDVSVKYVTTGTMTVKNPEELTSDGLNTLIDSLSSSLNIHPSELELSIDDDGVVTFTIISDEFDELEKLLNVTRGTEFEETLNELLKDTSIVVDKVSLTGDLEVSLVGSVPSTEIPESTRELLQKVSDTYDFSWNVTGTNIFLN